MSLRKNEVKVLNILKKYYDEQSNSQSLRALDSAKIAILCNLNLHGVREALRLLLARGLVLRIVSQRHNVFWECASDKELVESALNVKEEKKLCEMTEIKTENGV